VVSLTEFHEGCHGQSGEQPKTPVVKNPTCRCRPIFYADHRCHSGFSKENKNSIFGMAADNNILFPIAIEIMNGHSTGVIAYRKRGD